MGLIFVCSIIYSAAESEAEDVQVLLLLLLSSETLTQLYRALWIGLKGDTRDEMFAGVSARVRSPRRTSVPDDVPQV